MAVKLKTVPIVTVAQAGVRQPLSPTSLLVYSVTIQSLAANTGSQYVGDDTVTSSNGQVFGPGDIAEIEGPPSSRGAEQFDLAEIYVDSSTANAEFRITAWIRK